MATLKQKLKIAATLKGDRITALAQRWGCSDTAVHLVASGLAKAARLLKEIEAYIQEDADATKTD